MSTKNIIFQKKPIHKNEEPKWIKRYLRKKYHHLTGTALVYKKY